MRPRLRYPPPITTGARNHDGLRSLIGDALVGVDPGLAQPDPRRRTRRSRAPQTQAPDETSTERHSGVS